MYDKYCENKFNSLLYDVYELHCNPTGTYNAPTSEMSTEVFFPYLSLFILFNFFFSNFTCTIIMCIALQS